MDKVFFLAYLCKVPSLKILSKVVNLARGRKVVIFIEDYRRGDEHVFTNFLRSDPKHIEDRIVELQNWTEEVARKISEYCTNEEIEIPAIEFAPLEGSHWIKSLASNLEKGAAELLLVDHIAKPIDERLLEKLATLDVDVLMLQKSFWSVPLNVVCAIDPLHQGDKQASVDLSIVERGKRWQDNLGARVTLVYCRHVAPYLVKYKSQILQEQKLHIQEFMYEHHLNHFSLRLFDGNPEVSLPKAVRTLKANVLVIGACKRSAVSRFWSGSTVDILLKQPPCDLLLVNGTSFLT
ncbi:universal stress protein [Vibrio natriegens]|jgi:nucleotide-binding universal stress UspA family protein